MSPKTDPTRKLKKHFNAQKRAGLPLQDLVFKLESYWAGQGCIVQQPYDVEVGAGTMHPETFFRVLGPNPYRVAYVQPSRRPADGRYGENPNRLYKHSQLQVILKPSPRDVQDLYLNSLREIGINLKEHDIRFEEDNWESPTLGAWGVGWQVLLDGLEVTQFTYFQQSGGLDLDPVSCELTYGLERIAVFLQDVDSVFQLRWSNDVTYGQIRLAEEEQFSTYSFEWADAKRMREMFDLCEKEAKAILARRDRVKGERERKPPILAAYDFCLKCSHFFNLLDSRGAISITERAVLIGRVRALSCQIAQGYCEANGWMEVLPAQRSVSNAPQMQVQK